LAGAFGWRRFSFSSIQHRFLKNGASFSFFKGFPGQFCPNWQAFFPPGFLESEKPPPKKRFSLNAQQI